MIQQRFNEDVMTPDEAWHSWDAYLDLETLDDQVLVKSWLYTVDNDAWPNYREQLKRIIDSRDSATALLVGMKLRGEV